MNEEIFETPKSMGMRKEVKVNNFKTKLDEKPENSYVKPEREVRDEIISKKRRARKTAEKKENEAVIEASRKAEEDFELGL